jgi:hypothetical protein
VGEWVWVYHPHPHPPPPPHHHHHHHHYTSSSGRGVCKHLFSSPGWLFESPRRPTNHDTGALQVGSSWRSWCSMCHCQW